MLPGWFGLPAEGWKVLTWGGLRGGISVALALALPAGHERDAILTMTYVVVIFSILVQGLTIKPLIARLPGSGAGGAAEGGAQEGGPVRPH